MRKRFPLSFHKEFDDALAAKKTAKEGSPDKELQIRKAENGFRLVERLTTSEAKAVENARKPKKRKGTIYDSQY